MPFGLTDVKSQVYYKRGVYSQNRVVIAVALCFLKRSLKYSPSNLDAFYRLGYLYAISNRPQESLSVYDGLLKLSPNFAKFHYNIAIVLASLEDRQSASHHAREALKQDPHDEESLFLLETILQGKRVILTQREKAEKKVDRENLQLYNPETN